MNIASYPKWADTSGRRKGENHLLLDSETEEESKSVITTTSKDTVTTVKKSNVSFSKMAENQESQRRLIASFLRACPVLSPLQGHQGIVDVVRAYFTGINVNIRLVTDDDIHQIFAAVLHNTNQELSVSSQESRLLNANSEPPFSSFDLEENSEIVSALTGIGATSGLDSAVAGSAGTGSTVPSTVGPNSAVRVAGSAGTGSTVPSTVVDSSADVCTNADDNNGNNDGEYNTKEEERDE
jgi:hypothetical protein